MDQHRFYDFPLNVVPKIIKGSKMNGGSKPIFLTGFFKQGPSFHGFLTPLSKENLLILIIDRQEGR